VRYIDRELVRESIIAEWFERADAAEKEVSECEEAERPQAIKDRATVWRDLKEILEEASFHKCWYCESTNIRSDNAVDHYRPKSEVAESPHHPGYWWLAFRWWNYRFACTYCNSLRTNRETGERGGKQARFPLWVEDNRAWREEDDLSLEQPMLLDPTVRDDPQVLWFDESGEAQPRHSKEDRYLHDRAKTSIEAYFLNHPRIKDQREVILGDIKRRLIQAEEYFKRFRSTGDASAEIAFHNETAWLRKQMKERAPYSAAVRYLLMGYRGTYIAADYALSEP
jgi:uncharacterized protein (TIGR02646 family)